MGKVRGGKMALEKMVVEKWSGKEEGKERENEKGREKRMERELKNREIKKRKQSEKRITRNGCHEFARFFLFFDQISGVLCCFVVRF